MKKLFCIIICTILFSQYTFASNYLHVRNEHDEKMRISVATENPDFLLAIDRKVKYNDPKVGYVYLTDTNKTLIIGSSPVVFLGASLDDKIELYGIDVIGLGGATDYFTNEWITHINRKYDKIIIFNGINSINVFIASGNLEEEISDIGNEIKNTYDNYSSLLNDNGKIAITKIQPYPIVEDEYTRNYNLRLQKINDYIDNLGIKQIDFKYFDLGRNVHTFDKQLFEEYLDLINRTL